MNTQTEKRYYPTIKQSFVLLLQLNLLFIAISTVIFSIEYLVKICWGVDRNLPDPVSSFIVYVTAFIITLFLVFKKFQPGYTCGFKPKFKIISIGTLLIAIVTSMAAMNITGLLIHLIPIPGWYENIFEQKTEPGMFTFLTIVIAAPILEEIFFRGIILEGLLKNYTPKKAIIYSSLIFGIAHVDPLNSIDPAIGGLILGWLYWKSKSLIPGITIHFVNNLLAYSAMGRPENEISPTVGSGLVIGVVISLIIMVIGYKILNNKFQPG